MNVTAWKDAPKAVKEKRGFWKERVTFTPPKYDIGKAEETM